MKALVFTCVVLIASVCHADHEDIRATLANGEQLISVGGVAVGKSASTSSMAYRRPVSLSQRKAQIQANQGRMRHVGGGFGNGRYEGVGFSSYSADDAIRRCCYWGRRTPIDIGVARGPGGWYANVIYR